MLRVMWTNRPAALVGEPVQGVQQAGHGERHGAVHLRNLREQVPHAMPLPSARRGMRLSIRVPF